MTSSRGQIAEQLVVDRLRAVLPDTVAVLPNVRWLSRDHGTEHEGEADVIIGDPERGILVLEVKSGNVRRDGNGTWYAGGEPLKRSPFTQAADSKHALVRKLHELQAWPAGRKPINGHGVAFPDADLDSMRGRLGLDALGPDADPDLVADQSTFADTADGRLELQGFVDRAFEHWSGTAGTYPPGHDGIDLLLATMTEPFEIRSMLRHEIATGQAETVKLTSGQYQLLSTLRGVRRAAIVGGAGTGKTMLAAEKARRLAREGFSTLLVCFNAPLARALGEDTREVAEATGLLTVTTFHQLCQDLGREANVLRERPDPVPQAWWDETLPRALDDAVEKLGPRFHAIVVDEGQDFAANWLLSLQEFSHGRSDDVLYVFHDPAQAIYREDVVGQLGLEEIFLGQNCRNPQPIHDLVRRFAGGGLESVALRIDGRAPELIEADGDAATLEALRKVLHRLRSEEGVAPWDMAVLTGIHLNESAVWRQRTFGNEVLANPSVDDAGKHLGLAAADTPELPTDTILCETIRRFKGLERPVIVLVELKPDDERLDQHLYVGASRARQHLVVIAPAAVTERLR
jgi:hypothetical protein